VRQELPAAVDQLPEAGPEARQILAAGGGPHRRAARAPREQVSAIYACSHIDSATPLLSIWGSSSWHASASECVSSQQDSRAN
jgi:hypothetical protein